MSSTTSPLEERRLLGVGLALAGFFMFTGTDTAAKWLGLVGIPAMQIVFLRYIVHLGIVSAIYLPQRGVGLLRTSHLRLQILRAFALLIASVCNFIAVQYLPLTVTGSIHFTMPLMVCALSVPLLGESVGWRRWTAIIVGFIGVLIIVRPGTEAFHPASLLVFAAAMSSSFYFLITRKLAGVDSAATQQFYVAIFASIVLAPFALADWAWPTRAIDWAFFFGIGVFGYVGHQLSVMAHHWAPAAVIAPFAYLQIIFMTAASWLIFNEPPDVWLYIGAPIVIASGLYIWMREMSLAKPVSEPDMRR